MLLLLLFLLLHSLLVSLVMHLLQLFHLFDKLLFGFDHRVLISSHPLRVFRTFVGEELFVL